MDTINPAMDTTQQIFIAVLVVLITLGWITGKFVLVNSNFVFSSILSDL